MWQRLKCWLNGSTPITQQHPYFGNLRFMGGKQPADDDYWEAELTFGEGREPLTVLIYASIEGPTDAQVAFCRRALADPDALFQRCWPVFAPDFETWAGEPFSGDWRDQFELLGLDLPRDGDERNEWSVGYYVDAASHYFTARFAGGRAIDNQIDG